MKYQPGLLDAFISPITGKIRRLLFDLEKDYIITGNRDNEAFPSPILIDIRLQIIEILTNLGQTKFILQTAKEGLENSQILDQLVDGILLTTQGILSTIPTSSYVPNSLNYNKLWQGNISNLPAQVQRVSLLNLPGFTSISPAANFGLYNLYTAGFPFINLSDPLGDPGLVPTTTMRLDMSNQPNLRVNRLWIGKANPIPPVITFDGVPPYVHVEGDLNWDVRSVGSNAYGVPTETGLEPGTILIGDFENPGDIIQKGLSYKSIFRGNSLSQIVESEDLTLLEERVTYLEDVVIPAIEADIASIEGEILVIQGQITFLEGEVTLLQAAVGILQGQVLIIQGQIIALNTRIDDLRLNTIPADGDVSFYGYKLIDLADPVSPTDGVNLQTLESAIDGAIGNIMLDGFVLGDSDETGLIHTTRGPDCTLDVIPAANDVSFNNFKITDLKAEQVYQLDAINSNFLWDLMHDEVGVIWA